MNATMYYSTTGHANTRERISLTVISRFILLLMNKNTLAKIFVDVCTRGKEAREFERMAWKESIEILHGA